MDRWPDIPTNVSLDFLKRLDQEEPGRWLAQPKIDGRRRIAWSQPHIKDMAVCELRPRYEWCYRAKNKDDCQPLQPELQAAFESLPWPDGIGLDMELSGPRHAGQPHALHVFDLLMLHGRWFGGIPFGERTRSLADIWKHVSAELAADARLLDDFMGLYMQQLAPTATRPAMPALAVHIVPTFPNPGLYDRYLEQLQDPLSEGLVVRRADSVMIGGRDHCMKHPHCFKVKYRNVKET